MPVNRSRTVELARVRSASSATSAATDATMPGSGSETQAGSADGDCAAQQPVAGRLLVEPQQGLPEPGGVGVDDPVADVVGEGAEVGDVVVHAFQLEQERSHEAVLLIDLDAGGGLDRHRVGGGCARRRCPR